MATAWPMLRLDSVTAYRYADYDAPLWEKPNGSYARFHRPGTGPTQYLCLHPLGPWAEAVRSYELISDSVANIDDLALNLHRTWVLEADLGDVLDLDFSHAEFLGLDPKDLIDNDYTPCQQAAATYGRATSGFPSIWRYPSAALPGTYNLVIFGGYRMVPIGRSTARGKMAGCLLADRGRPPRELLQLMHHAGYDPSLHSSYAAWLNGIAATPFRQPSRFAYQQS